MKSCIWILFLLLGTMSQSLATFDEMGSTDDKQQLSSAETISTQPPSSPTQPPSSPTQPPTPTTQPPSPPTTQPPSPTTQSPSPTTQSPSPTTKPTPSRPSTTPSISTTSNPSTATSSSSSTDKTTENPDECKFVPSCPATGQDLIPIPCKGFCSLFWECKDGVGTLKTCPKFFFLTRNFNPKTKQCQLMGVNCDWYKDPK